MEYDVCIVGAGPAGLSAAIRLKQRCSEEGKDLSVCVVEKGAEVGAHILSGNVLEPRALDELLPDWRTQGAPLTTAATDDRLYLLTEKRALRLPTPPQMRNKGNFVVSLSKLVRWLGAKAEEAGVEVLPGFAAAELLTTRAGAVAGVATGDVGLAKDGSRKDTFASGVELRARATLLAEGCRGSLSEEAMRRFGLRDNTDPQTYALGLKEVWEVRPEVHVPGQVLHTVGYPLDHSVYGGSFLYHMSDNRIALGLVVALDYRDPYLNPFQEFQRWKAHPRIRRLLEGGTCVQYGARTLNEGGLQSIPQLAFPGGALIGCGAGFLNVPKIKGTHTAMKSGMLAADAAFDALTSGAAAAGMPADLAAYEPALRESWVGEELEKVRNIRPGFRFGLYPGLAHAAVDTYLLRGRAPWTLRQRHADHEALRPAAEFAPRSYPAPDNEVTFGMADSLFRSGTNHGHDEPAHLRLLNPGVPSVINLPVYAGPESRYCPAGVYEYVAGEVGGERLQINAQNCLHCKACDVKDPLQNIRWTVPEGGGGPAYNVM
ncbi:hypothetical protein WJX81_006596 [Elliptochloris bilobata]|uniref:Electron transfer flavoprotein-ubiquinone oxidoreductase n=1 Tax=Elliptochloris bilobata TaxID=381761 RepID=A0AAW1RR18_9CHLO